MKAPEHDRFRSKQMAHQVAHLLRVITGDTVDVVPGWSEGKKMGWSVIRTDPAGKEHEV